MLYVGADLASVAGHCVEPALIDESLKVDRRHADRPGEKMGYWPSYSTIAPECRATYLAWLEGGRRDPGVGIGYVFIFFYGLERRVLHDAYTLEDAEARAEIPAIRREVRRLLDLYRDSRSFVGYATRFLDIPFDEVSDDPSDFVPPLWQQGAELPFDLRYRIGRLGEQGKPLPPRWALAWVTSDPQTEIRTPARRCREQFEELFLRRYTADHGDGIPLKPCKRSVRSTYRPASASFHGVIAISTSAPDITSLVGPRRKLNALVVACQDDLDAYSRWIGRNPDKVDTLAAAAFLPAELIEMTSSPAATELGNRLTLRLAGNDSARIAVEDALEEWLPEAGKKQTKKQAVEAANLLGHLGFGIEPDVRFVPHRVARGDELIIFPMTPEDAAHHAPTSAYSAACLLLHLAVMVSAADGDVSKEEQAKLSDHVTEGVLLDDTERKRLVAHLEWLVAHPPGVAGVKKRVEELGDDQRRAVARYLVQVAWADGHVDPGEVKVLTKIYRLLGLDPGDVHDEIHAMSSAGELDPKTDQPVSFEPTIPPAPTYAIPGPPREETTSPKSEPVATPRCNELDHASIRAKLTETAAVSALLSGIFADEAEADASPRAPADEASDEIRCGLDLAHSRLLASLGSREEWGREDYDALADSFGLMPDGAFEVLNDVAFERCDAPIVEGDDPVFVDLEIHEELIR